MGWVKWLVDLEPPALRQAKYVHCATQQFRLIFARELVAAAVAGNIIKLLFLKRKIRSPRRNSRPVMLDQDADLRAVRDRNGAGGRCHKRPPPPVWQRRLSLRG